MLLEMMADRVSRLCSIFFDSDSVRLSCGSLLSSVMKSIPFLISTLATPDHRDLKHAMRLLLGHQGGVRLFGNGGG